MKTIARHSIDRADAVDRLASRIKQLDAMLGFARRDGSSLNRLILAARAVAGYQAALDPSAPELRRAIGLGAQAAAAIFALASEAEGRRIKLPIGDGPPVAAVTTGPDSTSDTGNWMIGYYFATIARDRASLERLCATPIDVLTRSDTRGDAYGELFVEALQAVGRGQPAAETGELLANALDATDEKQIKIESVDRVLNLVVSEMDLLYRILDKDAEGFDKALVTALERHKKYWTEIEREPDAPEALLPLGVVAMVCLARDRGLAVQVKSDYLPEPLIAGK